MPDIPDDAVCGGLVIIQPGDQQLSSLHSCGKCSYGFAGCLLTVAGDLQSLHELTHRLTVHATYLQHCS